MSMTTYQIRCGIQKGGEITGLLWYKHVLLHIHSLLLSHTEIVKNVLGFLFLWNFKSPQLRGDLNCIKTLNPCVTS